MSDSPRWHLDGLPGTTGIVEVMLYADHVAAVAAAERKGRLDAWDSTHLLERERYVFNEGIKAARDAVAAVVQGNQMFYTTAISDALAAIDGLTNGKKEA